MHILILPISAAFQLFLITFYVAIVTVRERDEGARILFNKYNL